MPISGPRSYTDPSMVFRMMSAAIRMGMTSWPNPEKEAIPIELYTLTSSSAPTKIGRATRVTKDSTWWTNSGQVPWKSAMAMLRRVPPSSITSA